MNIQPPETFWKIWSILNLYWDFLNYGLLEHVINKCGSEGLKQQMQAYAHQLSIFKQTTRLCDFESWPCREDGPPEDYLKKVVVKMRHEWSQCTLHDVESFKKVLVHKFFLPEFDILIQKAERGCVCVIWLTSPSIATLLQQNLVNIETEVFKKHGINSVTIDGQDVYLRIIGEISLEQKYCSTQDTATSGPTLSTPVPLDLSSETGPQHPSSLTTASMTSSPQYREQQPPPSVISDHRTPSPDPEVPSTTQLAAVTTPPHNSAQENTGMSSSNGCYRV